MGADQILERVTLPDGQEMVLTRWDDNITIFVGKRPLMSNFEHGSEDEFGRIVAERLVAAGIKKPRMLIGGLGLGFTLRAALDVLPAAAHVVIAELNRVIVDWCEGPLAAAAGHALADPRVELVLGDVADVIARATPGALDAIILDLYEGPFDELQGRTDPFYSAGALARQRLALVPGGVLAVWAEAEDAPYAARLAAAGFEVTVHPIPSGAECHVVYLGRRLG